MCKSNHEAKDHLLLITHWFIKSGPCFYHALSSLDYPKNLEIVCRRVDMTSEEWKEKMWSAIPMSIPLGLWKGYSLCACMSFLLLSLLVVSCIPLLSLCGFQVCSTGTGVMSLYTHSNYISTVLNGKEEGYLHQSRFNMWVTSLQASHSTRGWTICILISLASCLILILTSFSINFLYSANQSTFPEPFPHFSNG